MTAALSVTSPDFADGGLIPVAHTGNGPDLSPALELSGLCADAKSIAVTMDDMSHPIRGYNHWLIWNLPAQPHIPASVPQGETVASLGGAVQGCGYGKHRYRGPLPPFHLSHRYQFNVYVLDCVLSLPHTARKRNLIAAMQGHILQLGTLSGHYY
ncbi:MAG: YbhB/YbcL family Raf kinase inhibitor-like protein [Oscillospiraceae bacterium]|nr:YbhB/YbcL family Raf kinase inhibitor-like protein [Oscillospiraceae bacterium]